MHTIPNAALHPNGKYFAGQSMDNKVPIFLYSFQIVVYDAKGNFKLNRKKKFTGHLVAGYSCQLDFSVDGKFICSGDGNGNLWFWDWKTTKNYRILKVHEAVCMGALWHPIHPSKVLTCSWDKTIKLWD